MMRAIEFETYVKDGLIKIPEEYDRLNNKKIKVIFLSEEENSSEDFIDFLLYNLIKMDDFTSLERYAIYDE